MRLFNVLRLPLLLQGFLVPLLIPPALVAAASGDRRVLAGLCAALLLCAAESLPVFFTLKKKPVSIPANDGFLIVSASWLLFVFAGAVPFYFSGLAFSLCDAVFESAAAFTTTGVSVRASAEMLPPALLLWKALSCWAGGAGIIILSVALLPLVGAGGFQLFRAETPGPEKERLTPTIAATAKRLYLIYSALTAILFVLYLAGGMSVFDAVCHALAIVSSGSVSTKNAGFAYFDSAYIRRVTIVFMLLSGVNFNLFFLLLKGRLKDISRNTEFRAYLCLFFAASALVFLSRQSGGGDAHEARTWTNAAFQTASLLSTTGSALQNFNLWPPLAQAVLFMLMMSGGCSGSASGSVKIIRHVILCKQAAREIKHLLFPNAVFSIRLNHDAAHKDVVAGAAGFVALYMLTVLVVTLVSAAAGLDVWASLNVAFALLGNIGAGFGVVFEGGASGFGGNFNSFPDYIKWFYSFIMIAGRLELWTVFVLFTPLFWRGRFARRTA
ncbi:MAG: TrkH family potassium uptake protein [Spirochaetaceae bacterium]|jgi:trk system potassium uptake protein TrkH|nr:TrkH family potassium uptake protein [Spirochaetaceae bacterium]